MNALTLHVSLAHLVQSFGGQRSEAECEAAIDLAWETLSVSGLGIRLEYEAAGMQAATALISGGDSDSDEAGAAVVARFRDALSAAFSTLDVRA